MVLGFIPKCVYMYRLWVKSSGWPSRGVPHKYTSIPVKSSAPHFNTSLLVTYYLEAHPQTVRVLSQSNCPNATQKHLSGPNDPTSYRSTCWGSIIYVCWARPRLGSYR